MAEIGGIVKALRSVQKQALVGLDLFGNDAAETTNATLQMSSTIIS